MDPNEALRRLRHLLQSKAVDALFNDNGDLASKEAARNAGERLNEAVDVFDGLDAWLVRGGFLPADWEKARGAK